MLELTTTPVREYFRPNFWPNTPDILPGHLQTGGLPAFRSRLVLATTLSSNYGIYGPAFELGENTPAKPGSEEYLNSEKYEIKTLGFAKAVKLKTADYSAEPDPADQTRRSRATSGCTSTPRTIPRSSATPNARRMGATLSSWWSTSILSWFRQVG